MELVNAREGAQQRRTGAPDAHDAVPGPLHRTRAGHHQREGGLVDTAAPDGRSCPDWLRPGERVMTVVAVGVLAVLLLACFATAIVPMGPPEAMVVALTVAATTSPEWAIAVAITAAVGQAAGKLLVFLAVRCKALRRVRLLNRLLHNRLITKVDS